LRSRLGIRKSALIVLLVLGGCAPEKPLRVLGEVPEFQLVDQKGQKFERTALDGHVWVADFVYTTCQGPCPRMSSHMRTLQKATGAEVKLVSFTVDPDNDTPAALAAYAEHFSADSTRWTFLTGDKQTLNMLDQDAFKLGTLGAGMDHSTRFVLVDKKGRIRGYYGIAEGNPVEKIAKDAARLEKEQG
jgi:cytochrome oxidase Cu insertion factor (SCO1/SenC/PrrC family)